MKSAIRLRPISSVGKLDQAILTRYPNASRREVVAFRDKVLDYVAERLASGDTIATITSEGDKTILTVLRFMEEEG